ncbi:hypothetical protein B0H14DRAFT_3508381 [Mycena olivaceomarginata]|nr:hypothetical protein B0H14DRAFT_3508381 [Mycena olivaceomarginata]
MQQPAACAHSKHPRRLLIPRRPLLIPAAPTSSTPRPPHPPVPVHVIRVPALRTRPCCGAVPASNTRPARFPYPARAVHSACAARARTRVPMPVPSTPPVSALKPIPFRLATASSPRLRLGTPVPSSFADPRAFLPSAAAPFPTVFFLGTPVPLPCPARAHTLLPTPPANARTRPRPVAPLLSFPSACHRAITHSCPSRLVAPYARPHPAHLTTAVPSSCALPCPPRPVPSPPAPAPHTVSARRRPHPAPSPHHVYLFRCYTGNAPSAHTRRRADTPIHRCYTSVHPLASSHLACNPALGASSYARLIDVPAPYPSPAPSSPHAIPPPHAAPRPSASAHTSIPAILRASAVFPPPSPHSLSALAPTLCLPLPRVLPAPPLCKLLRRRYFISHETSILTPPVSHYLPILPHSTQLVPVPVVVQRSTTAAIPFTPELETDAWDPFSDAFCALGVMLLQLNGMSEDL